MDGGAAQSWMGQMDRMTQDEYIFKFKQLLDIMHQLKGSIV